MNLKPGRRILQRRLSWWIHQILDYLSFQLFFILSDLFLIYIYIYIYISAIYYIYDICQCIYGLCTIMSVYTHTHTHTHTHIHRFESRWHSVGYLTSSLDYYLLDYVSLDYIYIIYIYILIGITMIKKSGKHLCATYRTLNSCFDIIRSHLQCITWSTPMEIEPTTLHLGQRSKPHASNAKLTSHGGNARPLNLMCLEGTFFKYDVTLQRTRSPLRPRLPKLALCNCINLTSWARNRLYNYKIKLNHIYIYI